MAITVKHKFVSAIPDSGDTTIVQPSNWNDDHQLVGTVPIANGGTGASTANDAFNALAPSQTGNNGKYLTTDGTNTSWATNPLGTVTSVDTGTGLTGGPITTSGTISFSNTAVGTWAATPSSANLAAAVSDETGSGSLVFGTNPNLYNPNIDVIDFSTSYSTALGVGQMGWDGNNTLGLGMAGGNVVQHIGEDVFIYVKASSAITKGQLCMFTGAVGASSVVTAAPATGVTNGQYIIGLAAESIALNGFGLIQVAGNLKGFDTSAFTTGDIVYYNSAVTGGLTNVYPTSGPIVTVAAITNAGNGGSGSAQIRPTVTQRITAGTAISVSQSSSGTTVTNTAPDQTVVMNSGTGISVTGTYPNFTVTNTAPSSGGTVTSVSGTAPVSVATGTTTPVISLASGYGDTQNPYASKTANYFLAAPNGSSGIPTFRAMVAADVPTLNQNTTGSAGSLATGRTIGITGDLTYTSPAFDGTSNVTAAGTLATVNSNVGTFTKVTVNAKGLTTAASQASLSDLSSPTGSFSFGSQNLTNLLDPVNAQDAATKNYVDSVAQGLNAKPAVLVATTANITLLGEQTIDGITTSSSRVLVKNQTLPAQNGIYVSSSTAWTRATDADTWAELVSAFVFVEEGTLQADTGWVCTVDPNGTLGVTAVTWAQFSGAGTYTAGTGLTLTGTQFSITNTAVAAGSYTNASITVNAQGQLTAASSGTAPVTSVSGTTGRITSTGGTTPVIDLASGIVSAGTTGSSTLIPVITVDTYGRVTAITTASNPQGTVTSVGGTGTVSGITLSGTVTSSGNLTLGGALDLSAPPVIGGTTPNLITGTTITATKYVGVSGGTF